MRVNVAVGGALASEVITGTIRLKAKSASARHPTMIASPRRINAGKGTGGRDRCASESRNVGVARGTTVAGAIVAFAGTAPSMRYSGMSSDEGKSTAAGASVSGGGGGSMETGCDIVAFFDGGAGIGAEITRFLGGGVGIGAGGTRFSGGGVGIGVGAGGF